MLNRFVLKQLCINFLGSIEFVHKFSKLCLCMKDVFYIFINLNKVLSAVKNRWKSTVDWLIILRVNNTICISAGSLRHRNPAIRFPFHPACARDYTGRGQRRNHLFIATEFYQTCSITGNQVVAWWSTLKESAFQFVTPL